MHPNIIPLSKNANTAIPRSYSSIPEYDTIKGWAKCGGAGDLYYHAMSAWLASRQTVGNVYDIYMSGVRYEAELDRFLELSRGSTMTAESRRTRENATLFRSLLIKEVDYLAGKVNTVLLPERPDKTETILPSPSLLPTPSIRSIVADVTMGFRERVAA